MMSRHDLVSIQTSNVYITGLAALNAIACMCQTICDVTSSNVLRVGQGEVGWYIYPKGENSITVQMVSEESHLTSQGLHAVFKCDLLARAG